ncbi:hypothetical protein [Crateriforma conspicua]|uniref:Uncharacterized protein n=1 Tax=Crateriforma conspicua TaxID=2527996 RepID=A0A5C5XSJ5_9PLAN|nr:hypothetical protein [Crateriforma conspicua]TWT65638.1 hypothetical protein Pan14r_51850 [Crateriforma conspicua]
MKFSIRSLLIAAFVVAALIAVSHTAAIKLDRRIEDLEQKRMLASRKAREADHWLKSLERFTSFSDARFSSALEMIAKEADIDAQKDAAQQAFALMGRKGLAEEEVRQLDEKIESLSRMRRFLPTIPVSNQLQ